ncbi:hypothetical protein PVA38_10715 [Streptococcus pneumoniae D39]|nr:hypothetical protein PVA38_10715 [Streptococcus pneumoniae D39]
MVYSKHLKGELHFSLLLEYSYHYYQPVSYTHLRAHETVLDLVCRLLLEKKKYLLLLQTYQIHQHHHSRTSHRLTSLSRNLITSQLRNRSHVLGNEDVEVFFFQAEDGIRDLVRSRGLGDVYKRQLVSFLA